MLGRTRCQAGIEQDRKARDPGRAAATVIAVPGYSPGNIGYATGGGVYTIEGYGAEGIIITLTNG